MIGVPGFLAPFQYPANESKDAADRELNDGDDYNNLDKEHTILIKYLFKVWKHFHHILWDKVKTYRTTSLSNSYSDIVKK